MPLSLFTSPSTSTSSLGLTISIFFLFLPSRRTRHSALYHLSTLECLFFSPYSHAIYVFFPLFSLLMSFDLSLSPSFFLSLAAAIITVGFLSLSLLLLINCLSSWIPGWIVACCLPSDCHFTLVPFSLTHICIHMHTRTHVIFFSLSAPRQK